MKKLEDHLLFIKEGCPYCTLVIDFARENELEIETASTLDDDVRGALIQIGGKAQVPCLLIKDKPMYESSEIIAYLKDRLH